MINKVKSSSNKQPSSSLSSPIGMQTPKCYYYTNSIYMGLLKNMNRVGTGIILFHDGTCAIVSYNGNSQFHGYCIFYRNRCLISVHYIRNRIVDIAYRIDGYLLYLKYNEQSKIDGDCYLVNLIQRSISLIVYQDGGIRSKTQMMSINKTPVQNIIATNAYHLVIGRVHGQVIRHQLTNDQITNIRMKKIGNKVQINYMPSNVNSHQKFAQGLGFQFLYRSPEHGGFNPQTNKCGDQFELKVIEKGIYKDNLLEGYGLRIFKNNNIYEGYFHRNVFHGEGALKNTQKGTWVYGIFANGQMADILDFSNQNVEQAKCNILLENLRSSEAFFINQMIQQNNFDFLDVELQKVSSRGDIQEFKMETFEDRKQQIMRRISAQFMELQSAQQQDIQNQMKRIKSSRAQLLKQSRKKQKNNIKEDNKQISTPKHKINYLIPQSLKNNRFNQFQQSDEVKDDLANLQKSKQIFNMTMKTLRQQRQQSGKNIGKIFHKTYQHLDRQLGKTLYQGSDLLKLHKVEKSKKQRKSHIFSPRPNQNNQTSQFSLGYSKSPRFSDRYMNQTSSHTPYKRRSPYRKTTIFQSTVKLRKIRPNQLHKNDQDIDQQSSLQKLQSIRKGSIDKKTLSSQKNKIKKTTNSPIFEEQKQKTKQSIVKFLYRLQTDTKTQKPDIFSVKNSFSSRDQSPLLKSQMLTSKN